MEILYGRCAGLDVHKKTVSACIQITDGNHTRKETATFRTFTADLERLCKWLEERQVNQVALEWTGVFWIPVWSILERSAADWKLTLINPQHVHALPAHKTDQKDGERIAELLQHGLLRGSFISAPTHSGVAPCDSASTVSSTGSGGCWRRPTSNSAPSSVLLMAGRRS